MSAYRRTLRPLAACTALCSFAIVFSSCGSSSPQATGTVVTAGNDAGPTVSARLEVADVPQAGGAALVNGSGDALYVFAPDHQRRVTCNAICVNSWPPLLVSSTSDVTSGPGVNRSLIGTVSYQDGARVVSYDGWPLYTYSSDRTPRMGSGQGVDLNGGYWYLVSPDGRPIVPTGDPQPTGPAS